MEDDKILAVLDAKNYGATSESKGDATHKILAYITNLDCGFGGLFFPNFETEEFSYPGPSIVPKHHFNLRVGHYRMQPSISDDAIRSKDKSMVKVFQGIIGRLITSGIYL